MHRRRKRERVERLKNRRRTEGAAEHGSACPRVRVEKRRVRVRSVSAKLLWPVDSGEVSERFKEHAWKACVGEILPWVQIPPSPPEFRFGFLAIGAGRFVNTSASLAKRDCLK